MLQAWLIIKNPPTSKNGPKNPPDETVLKDLFKKGHFELQPPCLHLLPVRMDDDVEENRGDDDEDL